MVHLWDMREGVLLKRLEGHPRPWRNVNALAVSRDGRMIAISDEERTLIAWNLSIGESRTQTIQAYCTRIQSLAFSPDDSLLATGSVYGTIELWCTKTWQQLGHSIICHKVTVRCIRFSPSGKLLAIATSKNIQIYDLSTSKCVADLKGYTDGSYNNSLAWMPDGTRLFSAGGNSDPNIREWDTSTWTQVGDPWEGHLKSIQNISLNSNGTLLASASDDNCVRLWRVSERRPIIVFKHPSEVRCVAFSPDDRQIFSGDQDKITEWPVFEDVLPKDCPKNVPKDDSKDAPKEQAIHQVLAINSDVRNACIAGDLHTAEMVLNREIDTDANNYTSYANRAFVMARKSDWDRALHDAINSVRIQPSFAGHISEGIALFGKKKFWAAASTAFDLASAFTNGDLKTTQLLHCDFQTIALFNAGQHKEAMLRVEELAISPNVDTLACRVVEAYLRVHLGNTAFNQKFYNEAVDHFTAAVNASAFFYKSAIHSTYEEFVVLFGWDLKSLWQNANQQQCHALFKAGRIGAAVESYRSTMDKSDEHTKAGLSAWFAALQ
ncbi:WD40-repeat-containing domain protein [Suillus plorans]|uniref:WD40-repeat-containing domain protein n=1 Tax=Suillus plorans TaxID=116603 RepID=A0A9P7AFC9_9AGAM|nr:WD40-repeat-containing domain protein [Suillus plorans]KAG1787157.1 WD40-repeat-containing domain protein [Suillus plorans]